MAGEQEQFALSVRLTVQGFNAIMNALGTMPYTQVKPLIDNLEEQAKSQVEAFNAQREATEAAVAPPPEVEAVEAEPVPVVQ